MKNHNAQNQAALFLQNLIEKDRKTGITRLPTIAELARQAKVAHVTMWKAMSAMKTAGILTATHGGGIKITAVSPLIDQPESTQASLLAQQDVRAGRSVQKWVSLKTQIEREILRGVYAPGSILPSPKELCRTYGVCYRTLKKTLDVLKNSDLLLLYKRTYRIASLSTTRHHNTVILIAATIPQENQRQWYPRAQDHYRILESECAKIQVTLTLVPAAEFDSDKIDQSPQREGQQATAMNPESVIGFIIWSVGMSADRITAAVAWSFGVSAHKPISILDETGYIRETAISPGNSSVRIFTLGVSTLAGRDTARFLIAAGHRRAAYISNASGALWSTMRLQGMQESFAAAGVPDAVSVFALDNSAFPVQTAHNEKPLSKQPVHLLFEQASTDPHITAWVCATDSLALDALIFLGRHGKNVPQDVSVMGFDDSFESSQHALTSYNFNGLAVMQAMLQHILNAKMAPSGKPVAPMEINGYIVERRTTAKVHQ